MSNISDYFGGGGGGGKDALKASTAVCAVDVTAGKAYAFLADGRLFDPAVNLGDSSYTETGSYNAVTVTNYNFNYFYAVGGDFSTPDLGAQFVLVGDTSPYNAWFGNTVQGSSGESASDNEGSLMGTSWGAGNSENRMQMKYLFDDTSYYYYHLYQSRYKITGHYNVQRKWMRVSKAGVGGGAGYDLTFTDIASDYTTHVSNYQAVANKRNYFAATARNNTVLYNTYQTANDQYGGCVIETHLLNTTGNKNPQTAASTHDLMSLPYSTDVLGNSFKVDDAAGTFIYWYIKNAASYSIEAKMITVAADGSSTTADCTFTGTEATGSPTYLGGASMQGVIFQTKNPLVFWLMSRPSKDKMYFQKLTLNSATNVITRSTYQTIDVPSNFQSSGSGTHGGQFYPGVTRYGDNKFCYVASQEILHYFDDTQIGNTASGSYVIKLPVTGDAEFNSTWTTTLDSDTTNTRNHLVTQFDKGVPGNETHLGSSTAHYGGDDNTTRRQYSVANWNPTLQGTFYTPAIALADASAGATVNIALHPGITSPTDLHTSYYFKKEDMFYPIVAEAQALEDRDTSGNPRNADIRYG